MRPADPDNPAKLNGHDYLERIYAALFDSPDCRVVFKPWREPKQDEIANEQARDTIVKLLGEV